jgi:hypothetical protein
MELEEVVVGGRHKLSVPTTSGYYIVTKIYTDKNENELVEAIKERDYGRFGASIRTFKLEDVIRKPVKPKRQKKEKKVTAKVDNKVRATLLDEIAGPWPDGIKLHSVDVEFWPNYKRRGRKTEDN